ncbi:hypothetical protein L195_g042771 [Trifolium pratense]|uniref:Uncharacterized protein n=1 Tax=Trifolium pratense TaxID=57577 RepID=A0A2K3M7E9_TRIPR|nr:hypothetical protein L195_g042771 [Trifolium pratense]
MTLKQVQCHFHPKQPHPSPSQIEQLKLHQANQLSSPSFHPNVSDLNRHAVIGDASIDRKMSIHKPHIVAESLGNTSDEILNMIESSPDGGGGFPGTKPSVQVSDLKKCI